MTAVLITGDSHTAALRRGQLAIEAEGRWPATLDLTIQPLGGGHLTCEPFFVDRGDHAEITTVSYRRQVERLPLADDRPGTIYGLSAPLHSARVWRHHAWRSFAPAAMTLPGTPVSTGMIRRLVLEDQRYVLDLLALLTRIGRRVFVIEAPYPFQHHPALAKASRDFVRHIDSLYRDLIGRELSRLAVAVVTVPEHCREDGFMRPEYAQPGDHHHGNERYGRMMMDEVLSFLGRDGAAMAEVSHDIENRI